MRYDAERDSAHARWVTQRVSLVRSERQQIACHQHVLAMVEFDVNFSHFTGKIRIRLRHLGFGREHGVRLKHDALDNQPSVGVINQRTDRGASLPV